MTAEPAGMPFPVLPSGAATGLRATVVDRVPPATAAAIGAVAARHRTTPFAVLLAVHHALLYRETGRRDLAVATLFANRTRPELHDTVGFLTTMVVLRTAVPPAATFADLVESTRATVLDAVTHQELPFHVVSRRPPAGDGLRLDDVVFQMLAESIEQHAEAAGVRFAGVVPDVAGRFDLELAVMPDGDGYAVKFYYPEGRVADADATAFLAAFTAAADELATDPRRTI